MYISLESYGDSEKHDELLTPQSPDQLMQKLTQQEREFLLSQKQNLKQVVAPSSIDTNCLSCKSQKLAEITPIQPHDYGNGLFVFVSFSMTENNIIQLSQEAKRYGAILVLRGLKNGSFRDTVNALKTIIEKSQNGLIIDPTLFKHYNVTQVPTFILSDAGKEPDRIAGNVTLSYVLTRMAQEGDHKERAAQLLIGKEKT